MSKDLFARHHGHDSSAPSDVSRKKAEGAETAKKQRKQAEKYEIADDAGF